MCKTYNTIGSLKAIKQQLELQNINDFKSLKAVIDFKQCKHPTNPILLLKISAITFA